MRFVVDVKDFSFNLKLISSVAPGGGTAFVSALVVKKGVLWAYVTNDLVTLKCKLKGASEVEGKGTAGIDFTRLDQCLKGRDKIQFENKETVFKFNQISENKKSSGKYNGDIAIIPVTAESIDTYDETLAMSKKAKTASLDESTFNALRSALQITNIQVIHSSDVLDTYIMLNKGTLEVVSSDNFHLSYTKTTCDSDSSFQLSPSKTMFDVLGKLSDFYGGSTDIEFATEVIKATNENYSISVPTIQSSNTSFLKVKQFIEELPKPVCSFKIKVS